MYCLHSNVDMAVVSCNQKAIAFNLKKNEHKLLEIPAVTNLQEKASRETSTSDRTAEASVDSIVCLTVSPCGEWLATCTLLKHLLVWKTSEWCLVSDRTMPRVASSVVFTPCSLHIVVADKSGDAFVFSASNWREEGTLLLGHLSMLLDVLICADGRYVITCDRDEKIRVSHFPNAYNIVSYCLGHEEFVTSVALLPHDASVLVSCSGDGTLRLWNYISGSLCKTYECTIDVVSNLSKTGISEYSQSGGATIPLKKVQCSKLDMSTSLASVIPDLYTGCLIYSIGSVDSSFNDINISITLVQVISFDAEPFDINFTPSGVLIVLTAEKHSLHAYTFDDKQGLFLAKKCSDKLRDSINSVNSYKDFFEIKFLGASQVSQLFKRKFDNLQEYHEKKKARLGSNTSSAAL